MSELKHSFIKLFGKTIAFPFTKVLAANDADEQQQKEEPSKDDTSDQITDPSTVTSNNDIPKSPSADVETSSLVISKTESVTQDKTLKKPDKILPCPRCNSMDTKFCYYNNYNVSQPRHFCKKCERYWTAGGTMRSVPVGAGRRKNKNCTASHYHPIMVSDALHMARMSVANDGTLFTFGSDSPLCDNMASDDHSSACGSSTATSSSPDKVGNSDLQEAAVVKNNQGFPPQVLCLPGLPWPCAWNSVQWNSPTHQAPTYWGIACTVPGSWNKHCVSPPSLFLDKSAPNSTPNSTVLGKHSRDGKMLNPGNSGKEEPNNSERSVWIPKTLRIDDPSAAAKSSIWATLRNRNEKTGSMGGGDLFKSFQSPDNSNNQAMGGSAALQANPAALSRSLNFHENVHLSRADHVEVI